MNQNLKENERELIKLVNFFKKKADKLLQEGKLGAEHQQLIIACENLANKLEMHASNRAEIFSQREMLKKLVKDNAVCPKCNKDAHLKLSGVHTTEQGWKSNRYTCRKCNIQFVWSRPNNPWDLVSYFEWYVEELRNQITEDAVDKEQSMELVDQLLENIGKLKPVLDASDRAYNDLKENENEMDKLIHGFKNHLLIEKIKMDTWEGE